MAACAAVGTHQWHGLGHAVAALHAGDGRGPDRSRLDIARGAALSRDVVAPASGAVSQPWWWETVQGGRRIRHRAFAQPALRVTAGVREPRLCYESLPV